MKITKVQFIKDWLNFKNGEEISNIKDKFINKKQTQLVPLSFIDVCYLLNTGTLVVKEIVDDTHEANDAIEIDYYV